MNQPPNTIRIPCESVSITGGGVAASSGRLLRAVPPDASFALESVNTASDATDADIEALSIPASCLDPDTAERLRELGAERTEDDDVLGAMIAAAREARAAAQPAYIELVERVAADDLPEDFPAERVDAMLHAAGKTYEDLARDTDRIAKSLAITEVSRLAAAHLIDRTFHNARRRVEAMR